MMTNKRNCLHEIVQFKCNNISTNSPNKLYLLLSFITCQSANFTHNLK